MNHKEFVGPLSDFETAARRCLGLLLSEGLAGHHKLLDVGCGGLRIGRHIIAYLDPSNYYGIEPERNVLQEGIDELNVLRNKKPVFNYTSEFDFCGLPEFDFVLAYDVFYHCGRTQLETFLDNLMGVLKPSSKIIISTMHTTAEFLETTKGAYHYRYASHSNVYYPTAYFIDLARRHGFEATVIEPPAYEWRQGTPRPAPRSTYCLRPML